jgi:hypothetical protein
VGPGESASVRLRLTAQAPAEPRRRAKGGTVSFGKDFDEIFAARLREADAFYESVTPTAVSPDAASVMRQALAGMLWSKQYYYWDGDAWLEEHNAHPLHRGSRDFRNRDWYHMINDDIISMPDKWCPCTPPGTSFHVADRNRRPTSPAAAPDAPRLYLHPSGQLPARVEFQRREPAGARLGNPLPASRRAACTARPISNSSDRRSTNSC